MRKEHVSTRRVLGWAACGVVPSKENADLCINQLKTDKVSVVGSTAVFQVLRLMSSGIMPSPEFIKVAKDQAAALKLH